MVTQHKHAHTHTHTHTYIHNFHLSQNGVSTHRNGLLDWVSMLKEAQYYKKLHNMDDKHISCLLQCFHNVLIHLKSSYLINRATVFTWLNTVAFITSVKGRCGNYSNMATTQYSKMMFISIISKKFWWLSNAATIEGVVFNQVNITCV